MSTRSIMIFIGLAQDRSRISQAAYAALVIEGEQSYNIFYGLDRGRYSRIRLNVLSKYLQYLSIHTLPDSREQLQIIFSSGDDILRDTWHEGELKQYSLKCLEPDQKIFDLKNGDLWYKIVRHMSFLKAEIVFPPADSFMAAMLPKVKKYAETYLASVDSSTVTCNAPTMTNWSGVAQNE